MVCVAPSLARQREARFDQIHGDDGAGADQFRRHDRAQSDRAGAEDGDRIVNVDAQRIDDGAGAGHDPATERREHLERGIFRHLDDAPLADHRMRRERGLSLIVVDDLGALRQRARSIDPGAVEIAIVEFVAVDRKSSVAARAVTAGRRRQDYRIAWSEARHACADVLDDARTLMAEHDRMRHRIDDVVAHRNIGMANAGGDHPDQHFVGARLGKRDFLEAERGILGARDRGGNLHGRFLPGSASGNVCRFVVAPQSNGAAPARQITIARNRITSVHGAVAPSLSGSTNVRRRQD
jgi:hypothetical protein